MTLELPDSLHYEERLGSYTGSVEIDGVSVNLMLDPDENQDLEPTRRRAREVLTEIVKYGRRAQEYAVQELLPLKNDVWLDDDEETPLTPEQFKERMTLEALVFYPKGGVTFYYDDGDLFFGHAIELVMDAAGNFVNADIPG